MVHGKIHPKVVLHPEMVLKGYMTKVARNRVTYFRSFDYIRNKITPQTDIVQELCESRGGRLGLSVLTSLLVSVDVKNY